MVGDSTSSSGSVSPAPSLPVLYFNVYIISMIITFKKYFPVEHNQPPSLALFKITFRKLGGRRAAVSLQFFSVSGFGHENMRPLLAAVTLRGAVLTGGHGPPGELDLPPPARVGLVFLK